MKPRKLNARFLEKVWGSQNLAPIYAAQSAKIGEVWFEDQPALALLVKFLFTSERLSVQVHPDDEQARRRGFDRGKTEMWVILRADAGASIALGFREELSVERLREAARSGEIEHLLNWIPVAPGDVYYVPPGTVHAIGAGVALCEIQQYSDVTYRLYDYGRPRALRLEESLEVADRGPYREPRRSATFGAEWTTVVDAAYFRTETRAMGAAELCEPVGRSTQLLICLAGAGWICGLPYQAGECWLIQRGTAAFRIQPQTETRWIRASV